MKNRLPSPPQRVQMGGMVKTIPYKKVDSLLVGRGLDRAAAVHQLPISLIDQRIEPGRVITRPYSNQTVRFDGACTGSEASGTVMTVPYKAR